MIQELAKQIQSRTSLLENWYQGRLHRLQAPKLPVYSSIDLRNSGYKIAVVDTNLFPSGFNNLCETFSENASRTFKTYFQRHYPSLRRILIFPEEHTRNLFYWKNVAALRRILTDAGLEVEVGSSSTLFSVDPTPIQEDGKELIRVHKLHLKEGRLQTDQFVPDAILLNNDLSAGTPDYLRDLKQVLLPSPQLGWFRRRKSDHFALYQGIVEEVASLLQIDPWILSPMTTVETGIDLTDEICLKRLRDSADRLLSLIRQKYLQHGIRREPYLFVKNNSGTYGMGIMHIDSGNQFLSLNRRLRNKLESSKGGVHVREYLLQEGIPTADLYRGKPLEPVVYLIGGEAIGTFFRIHEEKNEFENLNAPGMAFSCLCFHKVETPKKSYQLTYENKDQLFVIASFLGRIASLAAALEQESRQYDAA